MVEGQTYTAMPAFTGRNVPVTEIAKAMHKDAAVCKSWLTAGLHSSLAMQSSWTDQMSITITALTARFGKKSAISMPREKVEQQKERLPVQG